jgi:hypothetical protein
MAGDDGRGGTRRTEEKSGRRNEKKKKEGRQMEDGSKEERVVEGRGMAAAVESGDAFKWGKR